MRTTSIAAVTLPLCCGILFLSACRADSPPSADQSADAAVATTARFVIEFQRGQLELSGHAASPEHEQQLVDLAAQRFTAANRSITLKVFDAVPEHWQDTTVRMVDAVAATQSASAVLTEDVLSVRGIAMAGWSNRLLLRASLPESVELAIDIIKPDGEVSVADLCARAMAQYKAGPVNFEESGTVFRSSALPELARTVTLANFCRDSMIEITGHTDSSGDERWNQRLSLARAQAVADYLEQQGIAADRLNPVGVGSSLPIADNRTRYGRGLNRRIDIKFLAADGTALEP